MIGNYPEEGDRPVVGIEDHLLRFAWIGADNVHPNVAEADMPETACYAIFG